MSPFFPFLTAKQVAERLGVSDSRVRQLVGEGRLPQPVPGLPRMLFHDSDVEAYLRPGRSTGRASLVLAQDEPTQPLRLTVDVVSYLPSSWDDMRSPVHVRLYQGAGRNVALLTEPVEHGLSILINRVEDVVSMLEQDLLEPMRLSAADVTWVHIYPDQSRPDGPDDISNVVLTESDGPQRWRNPGWPPLSPDDLAKLLGGAHVDQWRWDHYTPELIQAWQRTGRPVEVVHDVAGVRPYAHALHALQSTGRQHGIPAEVLDAAETALLHAIALRTSPAALGAATAEDQRITRATNTCRLIPYELPGDVADRLPDLEHPLFPALQESLVAREAMHDALMLVDSYADRPDPVLFDALDHAVAAQDSLLTHLTGGAAGVPTRRDRFTCRWFDVAGDLDRTYLSSCKWLPATDDPRTTACPSVPGHLARRLVSGDEPAQFGTDPDGNVVARRTARNDRERTSFVVAWPTRYPVDPPLPSEVHLRADPTAGSGGDRPVYLVRRGQNIGLLPHPDRLSGWSYGYTGGSPHTLARHIAKFLEEYGRRVDVDTIRDYLTNPARNDEGVDIDVDALVPPRHLYVI